MRTIQRWTERVDGEQVHGEDALRDPVEVAQSMATKNEPVTPARPGPEAVPASPRISG